MSFNLDIWKLLAGLGIFLFGMLLIEESVSCRMQIYGMKDLLLSKEQVNNFERAMDTKEIREAELTKTEN